MYFISQFTNIKNPISITKNIKKMVRIYCQIEVLEKDDQDQICGLS